jgi:hypothetical protein
MDTSVFSDIWVFVASMAGLAGVTYLRALAIGRRNQIELHNCAREAVKMREHFQTQQRLRKMTRGAIIED